MDECGRRSAADDRFDVDRVDNFEIKERTELFADAGSRRRLRVIIIMQYVISTEDRTAFLLRRCRVIYEKCK